MIFLSKNEKYCENGYEKKRIELEDDIIFTKYNSFIPAKEKEFEEYKIEIKENKEYKDLSKKYKI